jgi:ribosomal protein S18 acetylase RimI-like enzyme
LAYDTQTDQQFKFRLFYLSNLFMNKNPFIRNAEFRDALYVAPLLVQAMGDLATFFTSNAGKAEEINLFETFFSQKGNQYSFENTMVFEMNGEVLGSSNGYDGGKLKELREPFINYIKTKYNIQFPVNDEETEPGEFYIDCVSVSPDEQGKGIGTQLLMAMIERGKQLNFKKIGLIVDVYNPEAKRLYVNLGFEKIKEKSFTGKRYEHLQFRIID